MLLGVGGMGFHLHGELTSQCKNPLQTAFRFERGQGEEIVRKLVVAGETAIHQAPIKMITEALFSSVKREVSPHHRAQWQ